VSLENDFPLFSILVHTYNRPQYLEKMVESLLCQTYKNLEIILVSDGGTKETIECIMKFKEKDFRIKNVFFPNNFFSFESPDQYFVDAINPALALSRGEYILFQADDDYLSSNYVEKMVLLFQENPECVVATPGTSITIDHLGKNKIRHESTLPRYIEGYKVGLDILSKKPFFKMAPVAQALTVKRNILESLGGFNCSMDTFNVFGFSALGILGCDKEAIFYYRQHDGQLNRVLKKSGHQHGWSGWENVAKSKKIFEIWEKKTNKDTAELVIRSLRYRYAKAVCSCFSEYFLQLNFKAIKNTFKKHAGFPVFWVVFPLYFFLLPFSVFYQGLKNIVRSVSKKIIKYLITKGAYP
jgi:glycosyltransferase involved in cell wall biosynthesis